ncbi:peptide chain release factor N(5)-glutamine methyltransferase [Lactovum odontotermitis]
MLWIEAVRELSGKLDEPFELEYVWRNLQALDKLAWLNLMRQEISAEDMAALKAIAMRLAQHEPPQYIVGWTEFCDLKFKVDARVLIPRPETEELVGMILKENGEKNLRLLDIGTGSAAIAVSLAKQRPDWKISASDISGSALEVAYENVQANEAVVELIQSDLLANISGTFDIIVSNPPYISPEDRAEVALSVLKNEPENALFAENDGLAIYERLAQQLPSALAAKGKIYLEIGYKQAEVVKALFETAFPEKIVTVHQDFDGKDRMVSVT